MKRKSGYIGAWLLAALMLAVPGWARSDRGSERGPKNEVYVLGDSLSDPGNLYNLTGFFPPAPYAHRYSDGPVWAEYFARDLRVPLDSRAIGGAFTGVIAPGLSNFNNVQYDFFPPLPGVHEELEALLADHPEGLNPLGLYVVWAGANDIFLGLVEQPLLESLVVGAVANVAETVSRLNAAGARNIAVVNLPDLGLTPFGLNPPPGYPSNFSQVLTGISLQFNTLLEDALGALPRRITKSLLLLDAYSYLQEIVEDPERFGLADVRTPCVYTDLSHGLDHCSEYLFWDDVHPTTAGHGILADLFRDEFCASERAVGRHGKALRSAPPGWQLTCRRASR